MNNNKNLFKISRKEKPKINQYDNFNKIINNKKISKF